MLQGYSASTVTITNEASPSERGYVGTLHLIGSDDSAQNTALDDAVGALSLSSTWKTLGSVQKNDQMSSNTQENVNPFALMIQAFSRLRDLTQQLLLLQTDELNEQIDNTQELTDEANYLSSVYAGLKDDALWNWKEDPKIQEIIKLMHDHNIKIDGKPVEEWLESVNKTRKIEEKVEWHWDPNVTHWKGGFCMPTVKHHWFAWTNFGITKEVTPASQEEGIPKHQLLRLERAVSAKAKEEGDANTRLQTEVVQLSQTLQNYISSITNVMTAQFRTVSSIISNWKG